MATRKLIHSMPATIYTYICEGDPNKNDCFMVEILTALDDDLSLAEAKKKALDKRQRRLGRKGPGWSQEMRE